jgi:hypothetical protein
MGTGSGDAGYKFKDEFSDLRFDMGGVWQLTMVHRQTAIFFLI